MRLRPGINARLTYVDQNVEFAPVLPQDGIVTRYIKSADGREWALFQLRQTICYRQQEYEHLLLSSRSGGKIDDFLPTPVFVFLAKDATISDGFSPDSSCHVAWGNLMRW